MDSPSSPFLLSLSLENVCEVLVLKCVLLLFPVFPYQNKSISIKIKWLVSVSHRSSLCTRLGEHSTRGFINSGTAPDGDRLLESNWAELVGTWAAVDALCGAPAVSPSRTASRGPGACGTKAQLGLRGVWASRVAEAAFLPPG